MSSLRTGSDGTPLVPPFHIEPYGFAWFVVDAEGEAVESFSTMLRSADDARADAERLRDELNGFGVIYRADALVAAREGPRGSLIPSQAKPRVRAGASPPGLRLAALSMVAPRTSRT